MFILAFEGKQYGFPKLHFFWIFAYYAKYNFASSYTQQKKHKETEGQIIRKSPGQIIFLEIK